MRIYWPSPNKWIYILVINILGSHEIIPRHQPQQVCSFNFIDLTGAPLHLQAQILQALDGALNEVQIALEQFCPTDLHFLQSNLKPAYLPFKISSTAELTKMNDSLQIRASDPHFDSKNYAGTVDTT